MNCPFCSNELSKFEHNEILLFCENVGCQINSDMARYTAVYSKNGDMREEIFYIEPYYVQTSFVADHSLVSTLDVIVLYDTVVIRRAIKLDFNALEATLNKLKVLLAFS